MGGGLVYFGMEPIKIVACMMNDAIVFYHCDMIERAYAHILVDTKEELLEKVYESISDRNKKVKLVCLNMEDEEEILKASPNFLIVKRKYRVMRGLDK